MWVQVPPSLPIQCRSGGMADTLVLETSAEMRAGSSPVFGTKFMDVLWIRDRATINTSYGGSIPPTSFFFVECGEIGRRTGKYRYESN